MERNRRSDKGVILLLSAFLLWAAPAAAAPIGSDLRSDPDSSLCPTTPDGLEIACTFSQLRLSEGHSRGEGVFSNYVGVITRWWVAAGAPSAATEEVRLRLRTFDGNRPARSASRFHSLPLADPRVHVFPARLPIDGGRRIGLDVIVKGTGEGVAAAPIAHTAQRIGELDEWLPPPLRIEEPPRRRLRGTELLLAAGIEPDLDDDSWGDETQDDCRYDPRRHSRCLEDDDPPRLDVRFASRQPFLSRRKVVLKVRSSEYGNLTVSGQMEFPNTTWGVAGEEAWAKPGEWKRLVIYIARGPRRAGEDLVARGGHPWVRAYAIATDASGNRDSRWNLRIRLPRG